MDIGMLLMIGLCIVLLGMVSSIVIFIDPKYLRFSIITMVVGICVVFFSAVVAFQLKTKVTNTVEYKISVKDTSYFYSDGERIRQAPLNQKVYKISNKGYSYLEERYMYKSWNGFYCTDKATELYLSEEDMMLLKD